MTGGAQILANILRQPDLWARLADEWPRHAESLQRAPNLADFDRLIFTGCGSAYHASLSMAAVASQLLGVPAVAVTSGDAVLFPEMVFAGKGSTALIAVSRSGRTTETLAAVEAYRRSATGPVVALTVGAQSDLAQAGDFLLDASVGNEPGVVHVGSLTTMLLTGLATLAEMAGETVQPTLKKAVIAAPQFLQAALPLAEQLGRDADIHNFSFLGSGPWRGIASEAMLKVKEMSHAPAESFHTLEFRHGLGAQIDPHALIVGFLSDRGAAAEQAVLDEFQAAQGAQTVSIGADVSGGVTAPTLALLPSLPEWARLPLALPFAQRLALERARLNGLDPDAPLNLQPVILLDGPLT